MIDLTIKFTGDQADLNRIPAVYGMQSLEGLNRSITILSHYLVEEKVRYKAPFSDDAILYMTAFKRGSFVTKLQLELSKEKILAGTIIGMTSAASFALTSDLISYSINNISGIQTEATTEELEKLLEKRPGDISALMQAITPGTKRGHTVIDQGVKNVFIINGENNVVNLNTESKEFINQKRETEEVEIKLMSVGRFNANGRDGGLFDLEKGHNIPFFVLQNSAPRTMGMLGRSLWLYTEGKKEEAQIYVKYKPTTDPSGRIVKLLVLDAWFDGGYLNSPQ